MKNYIPNGNGDLLTLRHPDMDQWAASNGVSLTWQPNRYDPSKPNELRAMSGLGGPNPHGYAYGFGGGPGGGGRLNFQFLDVLPNDHRWPGNPPRIFWFQWTQHPNPADNCQQSGWEAGAVNADGTPRHTPGSDCPWRITILEHLMWECPELLGGWVGYSFYAYAGVPFPIRPLIWTQYKNNDFMLHDLGVEQVISGGPVAQEVCGFFKIPAVPAGKEVVGNEIITGFGIDTTNKTPGTIMYHSFKLGFFGYEQPTMPPQDIKKHIEFVRPRELRVNYGGPGYGGV